MPDPLGHYQALIKALARLAGTHKAGRLPADVERFFPFDPGKLVVSRRAPYTPEEISKRIVRYTEFAAKYPQLLPENIRSKNFLARFGKEAPGFQAVADRGQMILQSKSEMIALCHWNAHVDNAWFWRNNSNEIECGLMDWGNVSQMNVAMALWGCLSGAEIDIWNNHLDELLALFATEFMRCGGPALHLAELKQCLTIYVAMMGLNWMLDTPGMLLKNPDLAGVENRLDSRIQNDERMRTQLLIMTAFLNLWEREDMTAVIAHLENRS